MLDLKFVVENREAVLRALAARGQSLESVQAFPGVGNQDPWTLDGERRALIQQTEELRHKQRTVGEEIARRGKAKQDAAELKAEMKGVAERIKQGEARLEEVKAAIERFLMVVPNLPDASVPVGKDAADNVEVRRVGEPRAFEFTPKGHAELGVELAILDFERAARLSGARFAVYWNAGARLERALIQFMLDLQTSRGYTEVIPPYLVTAETLTGTGQLPKFEGDLFKTAAGDRDLYLIPTAEVPLTNLHKDEILEADSLPRRYVAFTPCFRSEAGSYGKDVRGLFRQHQFHKVELVKLATPERSITNVAFDASRPPEPLKFSSLSPSRRSLPQRTSSRNNMPVGELCRPILRSGFDCSRPGMPESRTNCNTVRSSGGLPSSSLQMNTIVSAYGPLVMNVFEPFRMYSSPSRLAVDCIEPNASEPELGSVIAHAPIFSMVRMSRAHRFFWAVVPLAMIAAAVRPTDTPIAVTMPGEHLQSSMIGSMVKPPPPPPPPPPLESRSAPDSSAAMRRSNESAAIASIPNVLYILRRRSYGGRSPEESQRETCRLETPMSAASWAESIIRSSSIGSGAEA